tara:strand:+ start:429 stop:1343 length:915 start_codon:yes stop_codon:yes gene_type:complete
MNTPKVSIIMNCYNGERYLKNAIESIYKQSFQDWEIIFWDNCSTDSSAKIAKSYDNRLKYFIAPKKSILGEARYLAVSKCNSKYICFLDCDDEYLPDKLLLQYRMMESNNYALSCSQETLINDEGKNMITPKIKIKSGYIFDKLLQQYQIGFQSVMIRRSVLENEKLSFKPFFTNFMDYDLFMRIASKHEIGVIRNPLIRHRITKDSLTSKAYERVSIENKITLDDIFRDNPELKNKYKNEIKIAYEKLEYYDSIYLISINDYKKAKDKLKLIIFKKIKYFLLYILLVLRINRYLIMRALRRTS